MRPESIYKPIRGGLRRGSAGDADAPVASSGWIAGDRAFHCVQIVLAQGIGDIDGGYKMIIDHSAAHPAISGKFEFDSEVAGCSRGKAIPCPSVISPMAIAVVGLRAFCEPGNGKYCQSENRPAKRSGAHDPVRRPTKAIAGSGTGTFRWRQGRVPAPARRATPRCAGVRSVVGAGYGATGGLAPRPWLGSADRRRLTAGWRTGIMPPRPSLIKERSVVSAMSQQSPRL